jgi:hypothetical protein
LSTASAGEIANPKVMAVSINVVRRFMMILPLHATTWIAFPDARPPWAPTLPVHPRDFSTSRWAACDCTLHQFPVHPKGGMTAGYGPRLTTWALQQVVSFLGYNGRIANVAATAESDPEETFD